MSSAGPSSGKEGMKPQHAKPAAAPSAATGAVASQQAHRPRPPPSWMQSIKILDVIRYVIMLVMDLFGGRAALGKVPKDYVKRLLSLVWPVFNAPIGSPDAAGRFEILSLMFLAVVRTYIMDISADLMKRLNAAVYRRDMGLFKGIGKTGAYIAIAAAVLNSLVQLCRDRLQVLWRSKLSYEAHRRYFSNMNYYYLGTTKNPRSIPNADDIITREVNSSSSRLVSLVALLCKSLPPIFWFTYKMYSRNGFFQASLPHLYLLLAYEVVQRLFPKNIGILWRNKAATQGGYNEAMSRLQQHAEAISALKGSDKEKRILQKKYSRVTGASLDLHKGNTLKDLLFKVAYVYGCKSWIQSFVLYPVLNAAGNGMDNVGALVGFKNTVEIMTEMLIGNGDILTLHATAQYMRPTCRQLCELLDTLSTLSTQHSSQQVTNFAHDPDRIAFENVNVYTPAGQLLVRDLTFDVTRGRSLLLTGHNGAGKSSIFRCLGGLWPLREGVVTKPNSASLDGDDADIAADAVFYLPQRPYNVLGSLVDQLTYPHKDTSAGGDKSVRCIEREKHVLDLLRLVDLLHLVDDEGRWETEAVNWEERLSLGEQQRLAMARLFYHSPVFAILDECTSAVSADMERTLYAECMRRRITYITICHRPALKQYHSQNLHLLGEGSDGGWELHRLDDPVPPPAASAAVAVHEPSNEKASTEVRPVKKRGFFSKLSMLLRIVMPGTRRQTMLLMVFIMVRVYMMQLSAMLTGKLMRAALDGNRSVFFKLAACSAAQDLATAFCESSVTYLQNCMSVNWHDNLARYSQDLFLVRNNFYRTKYVDGRVVDADARLSQEISDLSEHLSAVLTKSIQPLASAAWLGYRLQVIVKEMYANTGGHSGSDVLTNLYIYIVAVSALVKYCMPDHETLVQIENQLEARFKFIHSRLRSHAESIAFFGGGKREKAIADEALEGLVQQQLATRRTESRFKMVSLSLLKNHEDPSCIISTSSIMNLYFQLQIAQGGTKGSLSPEALHSISEGISQSLESFSKLAGLYEHFSKLGGSSTRVCEAFDVLNEDIGQAETHSGHNSDEIVMENVDIVTPKAVTLAKDVSLRVERGKSLLVTGPNGVGKTSFFRILAGLWPTAARSTVSRPADGISLVPQKLYMCSGTLAEQVAYPHDVDSTPEMRKKITECLELVGIKRLVTRERRVRVTLGREVITKLVKQKAELEQSCKVSVSIDSDDLVICGGEASCAKAVGAISHHTETKVEVQSNEAAGLDKVERWEAVLSLGEQQRLGIARILYHSPAFAVLDECTDAVSMDVERQLYEKIHAKGTTCITISKRLALPEFHENQLCLGTESSVRWELNEITKTSQ